jgi:pimeloyl-ACP methyl ester carboxylesterase
VRSETISLPGSGARVALRRTGDGPPVLLVHGQPGGLGDWEAVRAALGSDAETVAYDRPGYGGTDAAAGGLTRNADLAAELIETLGLGPAVVVGHSWGGGVALALARRRPGLVRGLVLAASVGARRSVGRVDRAMAAPVLGSALSAGFLATGALLVRVSPVRRRTPGLALLPDGAAPRIARELAHPRSWSAFMVEQRALVEEIEPLAATLGEIDVPARVLSGRHDRILDPAASKELARQLPAAEFVLVARAGHVLPDEAREAIADAVRALLG